MGKVSDKSVTRSSCSYQHIEEVISNYDKSSFVKNMSGKHCTPNTHEEVIELALDFHDIRIFGDIPGRCISIISQDNSPDNRSTKIKAVDY